MNELSLAFMVGPRPLLLKLTTSMALSDKTGRCRAKKMTYPSERLRAEGGERHGEVIRGFVHRSGTESHPVMFTSGQRG